MRGVEIQTYTIPASHQNFGQSDIVLTARELPEEFLISCCLPGSTDSLTSQASDCFAALQGIRRKAEGRGWHLCCYGSRRNVWPSAMSRSMGGGIKAYTLELGQPGSMDALVEIFDPDSPENYSSVVDQEAFAASWFQSLGH